MIVVEPGAASAGPLEDPQDIMLVTSNIIRNTALRRRARLALKLLRLAVNSTAAMPVGNRKAKTGGPGGTAGSNSVPTTG